MLKQILLGELKHEAENTRKLFNAVPDDVLEYKPNNFKGQYCQPRCVRFGYLQIRQRRHQQYGRHQS